MESLSEIMRESMNQIVDSITKVGIRQIIMDSKGVVGETFTAAIFNFLDQEKYRQINDLIFRIKSKTVQIDHILVSKYGLFVIETKNYKGYIYGNESDQYWTQNLCNCSKRFYSPIKQNLKHIEALREYLCDYPNLVFYSVIVFCGQDVTLKVKTTTDVACFLELFECINKYNSEVITGDIADNVFRKLQEQKRYDAELKEEHAATIHHNMKQYVENSNKNSICPNCGGSLVLRNSKYGQFTGCSNYPKCRFIAK